LGYEMKFSEYGEKIENSDMYAEDVKKQFRAKLMEARKKLEKLKNMDEMQVPQNPDGATAPPPKGPDGRYPIVTSGPHKGKRWSPQTPGPTNPAMKEATKAKKDYDGDGKVETPKDEVWGSRAKAAAKAGKPFKEEMDKVGDSKKTRTGVLTKTATGVKHKRTDYSDDEHGEAPSTVKAKSAAEKKADKSRDIKLPKHKGNTWGMKGGEKFGKKMEGSKPDFLDLDKDGNKKEPMKSAAKSKTVKEASKCNHTPEGKSCPVHGMKECGGMYEASHQEKTTMKHVKNPTAGEKKAAKDIKPGVKGYSDRVAMLKSAEKDGRLKEANSAKQQAAIAIAKKKAK